MHADVQPAHPLEIVRHRLRVFRNLSYPKSLLLPEKAQNPPQHNDNPHDPSS